MNELVDTEWTYLASLESCIDGYMSAMQNSNLPDALKGKEKVIFGNIKALCTFHKEIFLPALEAGSQSIDGISQCFVDHVSYTYVCVCMCMRGLIFGVKLVAHHWTQLTESFPMSTNVRGVS